MGGLVDRRDATHRPRQASRSVPVGDASADGHYLFGSAWDKPDLEWDYFQWSGGSQEALTSLVLAAYDLTGDRKYLDAATESFGIFTNCAGHEQYCDAIRKAPEAFFTWRSISGDARFDKAFP